LIYLVDADVGVTLCACGLIQHLPSALGCTWEDILFNTELRRLTAAITRGKSVGLSPDGQSRLSTLIKKCRMMNDSDVDEDDFIEASNAGANAGEAELVAAIQSFYPKQVIVVTGDRAALDDLFRNLPAGPMRTRVMGNVLCLEQVLRRILDTSGFAAMELGLVEGKKRLSCIISYFQSANQDASSLKASLDARILSMHGSCPGLLHT
jgi:hypothetical protein